MGRAFRTSLLLSISLSCASTMASCLDDRYDSSLQPLLCYTLTGSLIASQFTTEGPGSFSRFTYARDDAAAFIASDGAIRGAFLEQALRERRQQGPVEDHDFASAVLAYATPP
ncbi:MAG: hypothetical protein GAK44_00032 [Pseudomonas delhiensis]|nr:MAG: hypothetical protein GAK44_00032 [Pseudomonas delhiensis]